MPELPEVHTIAAALQQKIEGRRIDSVEILRDSVIKNPPEEFLLALQGRSIQGIERIAKYLLFRLDSGQMLAHLGMSGKFVLDENDHNDPYARVIFHLDNASRLIFAEIRCFGFLEYLKAGQASPRLQGLGPDALIQQDPETLKKRAQGRKTPIKNLLLDQHFLAGIGNIYAAEILFMAGIRPTRPTDKLGPKAWQGLSESIPAILNLALEHNGTTISDYRRVDEKKGEFQNFLKVYQRADQPCRVCKTPIKRIVQAARSSFYCPKCQR